MPRGITGKYGHGGKLERDGGTRRRDPWTRCRPNKEGLIGSDKPIFETIPLTCRGSPTDGITTPVQNESAAERSALKQSPT